MENGALADLMQAGAIVLRTAFCGPCFGAGDVPANGGLSIRHTTRNFPNREGSKPANGQMACGRAHGRALHRRDGAQRRRA
ncbi:MAG: aconitase family protein [Christensenellales bacterium]